jgi:hypothetical protein
MINFLGYTERSTYHITCVNRVKSHLKRICRDAGKERGFVPGRITDAWGYDNKTKTLYFCEIKVNPGDLLKAVSQIHDTVFKYKPKDSRIKVIPVIAVPKRLYDEFSKYDLGQWKSFRSLCKTANIAIWIIEQSNIRQIQGPKPKSPSKAQTGTKKKATTKRKPTAKAKASTKRKTTSKAKASVKHKTTAKVKIITKPKITHKVKTTAKRKNTARFKALKKRKSKS